jgi:hypothetical protein
MNNNNNTTTTTTTTTTTATTSFTDRLRVELVGDPDARFVFVGNFEVEEHWADATGRLPGSAVKSAAAVVNRMDELVVALAAEDDVVVLKEAPDRDFAAHLADAGLAPPLALTVDRHRAQKSVSEDAVDSPGLIRELRSLADGRTYLLPLGVSELEERLSTLTGLPHAVPPAEVFRRVNSKAYSRALASKLGLRAIPGWTVSCVDELSALVPTLLELLGRGDRVVLKESLGVSGKGVVVIDRPRRLEQLVAMLERRAATSGDRRLDLVVEEWVEKECDLNYQFVITRTGDVSFDFVKEALTHRGVHRGHVMPSRLSDAQVDELRSCAQRLGPHLFADGYHGVVGVDAILARDGELYPVLEINARFNMSTYQARISERLLGRDDVALARHYSLRLDEPIAFAELAGWLGDTLYDPARGRGLLVNDFAAVNAAAGGDGAFDGRLYGLCIASSREQAISLDADVEARLCALQEARR